MPALANTGTEQDRACLNCGHAHQYHLIDGGCLVFNFWCKGFVPSSQYVARKYIGDPMPTWVQEGTRVKVATTPGLKRYGLDGKAPAGSIGVIVALDGPGWWSWRVVFDFSSGGVQITLTEGVLKNLRKVR